MEDAIVKALADELYRLVQAEAVTAVTNICREWAALPLASQRAATMQQYYKQVCDLVFPSPEKDAVIREIRKHCPSDAIVGLVDLYHTDRKYTRLAMIELRKHSAKKAGHIGFTLYRLLEAG